MTEAWIRILVMAEDRNRIYIMTEAPKRIPTKIEVQIPIPYLD